MINIRRSGNIADVIASVRDVPARIVPYAASTALTRVAKQAATVELPAEMRSVFSGPTAYTLNSLRIEPATKDTLSARVMVKNQASGVAPENFLQPEVEGGGRKHKRLEAGLRYAGVLRAGQFAMPGKGVDLDANGNVTHRIAGGIKTNDQGAPEAAFIYDRHPGGWLPGSGGDMYAGAWCDFLGRSGRRLLHHYRKLRPGMPRGVPYLAPIVDAIKQISRYTEAEIMAAVITSYLTVFIETPTGASAPVFDGGTPGAGAPGQEIGLGMGAVVGLAPGEKPHMVNPARPNPNFEPFLLAILTQIGMALGIPRELLIKQFNSSYSASKAALLDAWVWCTR